MVFVELLDKRLQHLAPRLDARLSNRVNDNLSSSSSSKPKRCIASCEICDRSDDVTHNLSFYTLYFLGHKFIQYTIICYPPDIKIMWEYILINCIQEQLSILRTIKK